MAVSTLKITRFPKFVKKLIVGEKYIYKIPYSRNHGPEEC